MKRLLIATLSLLAIATVGLRPAQADLVPASIVDSEGTAGFNPFEVAFLAYRGDLSDQGIPGYNTLRMRYRLGRITAEDVVAAAIEAGYVTTAALDDDGYVKAVGNQIDIIANVY